MYDFFTLNDDKDCRMDCYKCNYATFTYEDYGKEIAGCRWDGR